jgi:hypothetical protein
MFVGARFNPVLVNSLVDPLVTELVSEFSFRDIMHVIEYHGIDVEVKRIPQILANMRPETLKPNLTQSCHLRATGLHGRPS